MKLDKSITIVKEHIEEKLGGNVTATKNEDMGVVIFAWTKNEKTVFSERFQRAYSYAELEQVVDPVILGKDFVEEYIVHPERPLEEVPEAVIEEMVELPIDESVEEEPEENS